MKHPTNTEVEEQECPCECESCLNLSHCVICYETSPKKIEEQDWREEFEEEFGKVIYGPPPDGAIINMEKIQTFITRLLKEKVKAAMLRTTHYLTLKHKKDVKQARLEERAKRYAYSRKYERKKREQGLCRKCGKKVCRNSIINCKKHLDLSRKYGRRYRAKLKELRDKLKEELR